MTGNATHGRVLITGAAGQLGVDLVAAADAAGHDVVALDRRGLDITDAAAVRQAVVESRPDIIINSAAWTAVDDCESDPDRAMAINGDAVESLVSAADSVGAHLVQISTDYVFDGTKSSPWVEHDPTNPQSAYGHSKLRGEAAAADHTVVRISWVCGAHGANMVKTILRVKDQHPVLRFVDDQLGHPSFTADLAPAIVEIGVAAPGGIMHVTNAGAVSWFEFAQAVLDAAGDDPGRVLPISTAELDPPRPAARPANSVLASTRHGSLGLTPLRDFREPLAELVAALQR